MMNYILFSLSLALFALIFVLMNRREQLKVYEAESREADHEVMYDKVASGVVGFIATCVAVDTWFGPGILWLTIIDAVAVLAAGLVIVYRLRRQGAVLATCIEARKRRIKAAQFLP